MTSAWCDEGWISYQLTTVLAYHLPMDSKRDQLETRVATLELMLVTERARPKPDKNELARLEKDLRDAKSALAMYNKEHA